MQLKEVKLPHDENWHYIYCENCGFSIMRKTSQFKGVCVRCGAEGMF